MSDRRNNDLTCAEAIRFLAAYIDAELDDSSRKDVERHLRLCRGCFSRHEFEKGLKDQLAALRSEPVSAVFRNRIRSLVARFEASASGYGTRPREDEEE